MPDDAHDHVRSAEQPFLHDLACLLAAPMQAWTTADGSIAPTAGAQGVYLGDTRIVRELTMRVDGWSVAHLSTDEGVPRRQELRGVLRRGGSIIDPEILLVRERVIAGDALTESITLVNASRRPVTLALAVHVTPDATPMHVIKAGGTRVGPMLMIDGGWTAADERVGVRLATDGACARDELGFEIAWRLEAPPGGSAAGSWSLHAVDSGAVVTAPRTRDVSAAAARIAVPDGRALDLGRLLRQAFADLDGLQLALRGLPEAQFIAAGAPWFLTLFGRDSIVAASMLLPASPQIAHGTLVALARLQGTTHDAASSETPGKIVHELRRDVTHHVGADERLSLPPRYYGTVDATPLWISLLHDAWQAGMSLDDVGALLPNLEAAVAWLRATAAADDRGFLTYHDPTGHGLANQGWKDSGDGIRWADGSLAVGPIALCEVQGYAVRAARHAADVLDALGRDGAADLRSWADEMAERFRAAFWVTDGATGTRYPAMALDARGDAVDGMASNMGHLLGTGILDVGERRAVVDRLMDPTLFSGFGIRTLSTTNGAYWPMRYHAGAVWPHDTAMIVDGMLADGFVEEARTVAEGLLAAAASFDWRLPELFAGVARDSSSRPIPYPAACRPQAWSAAAAVVVARALGGSIRDDASADGRPAPP
jgi:glycogen debranching enzyme